jgi:hypothetical protein
MFQDACPDARVGHGVRVFRAHTRYIYHLVETVFHHVCSVLCGQALFEEFGAGELQLLVFFGAVGHQQVEATAVS